MHYKLFFYKKSIARKIFLSIHKYRKKISYFSLIKKTRYKNFKRNKLYIISFSLVFARYITLFLNFIKQF